MSTPLPIVCPCARRGVLLGALVAASPATVRATDGDKIESLHNKEQSRRNPCCVWIYGRKDDEWQKPSQLSIRVGFTTDSPLLCSDSIVPAVAESIGRERSIVMPFTREK